jgi:hypothetical protein
MAVLGSSGLDHERSLAGSKKPGSVCKEKPRSGLVPGGILLFGNFAAAPGDEV